MLLGDKQTTAVPCHRAVALCVSSSLPIYPVCVWGLWVMYCFPWIRYKLSAHQCSVIGWWVRPLHCHIGSLTFDQVPGAAAFSHCRDTLNGPTHVHSSTDVEFLRKKTFYFDRGNWGGGSTPVLGLSQQEPVKETEVWVSLMWEWTEQKHNPGYDSSVSLRVWCQSDDE